MMNARLVAVLSLLNMPLIAEQYKAEIREYIEHIKNNSEVYCKDYHVYTHQDQVEGCYDKNTLKSIIKDNVRK